MRRRSKLGERRGRWRFAVVLAMAALGTISSAKAGDASAWVGRRVIVKYGTVLQVDGKVVDDGGRKRNQARGRDQTAFRVYRVQQTNGPWLWIAAERSGVKGWVKVDDLVPLDDSVDYFTKQILDNPSDASRYNARGNAWKALDQLDDAIADYTEAIRLNPKSVSALDNRGNTWRAKGDYDKALADFTEAIRIDPESAVAHHNRGVVWTAKKDYTSAIADFTEALRINPGFAHAHRGRARAWHARGEYDKALADYTEAIRLEPGYAVTRHNRGRAWFAKKEYDKALEDFTEALRLDPRSTVVHHNRGMVWYVKREYDKALEDFTQAIRLDPKLAAVQGSRDNPPADYVERARPNPGSVSARFDRALTRLDEEVDADESGHESEAEAPIHAAIVGHLGARRGQKNDAAQAFLDDAQANADPTAWPYPLVRFLRREIDEQTLLDQATDNDKMTEARYCLAFDQLLNGQTNEAMANFRWVRDRGRPGFEVDLAAAELQRLAENDSRAQE